MTAWRGAPRYDALCFVLARRRRRGGPSTRRLGVYGRPGSRGSSNFSGSGSTTGRCVVVPGGTLGGLRTQLRTNKRPATDRTPPMPMAWSWSPPVAYQRYPRPIAGGGAVTGVALPAAPSITGNGCSVPRSRLRQQAPGLRSAHGFPRYAIEEVLGKEAFPDRQ